MRPACFSYLSARETSASAGEVRGCGSGSPTGGAFDGLENRERVGKLSGGARLKARRDAFEGLAASVFTLRTRTKPEPSAPGRRSPSTRMPPAFNESSRRFRSRVSDDTDEGCGSCE